MQHAVWQQVRRGSLWAGALSWAASSLRSRPTCGCARSWGASACTCSLLILACSQVIASTSLYGPAHVCTHAAQVPICCVHCLVLSRSVCSHYLAAHARITNRKWSDGHVWTYEGKMRHGTIEYKVRRWQQAAAVHWAVLSRLTCWSIPHVVGLAHVSTSV